MAMSCFVRPRAFGLSGFMLRYIAGAGGIFESQPGLESRPGQLLSCNEALNDLVFVAALDHDRQPVAGFEVILYVFPRGDGSFCTTLVSHLVSPARSLSAFQASTALPEANCVSV